MQAIESGISTAVLVLCTVLYYCTMTVEFFRQRGWIELMIHVVVCTNPLGRRGTRGSGRIGVSKSMKKEREESFPLAFPPQLVDATDAALRRGDANGRPAPRNDGFSEDFLGNCPQRREETSE